ncbi:cupin domain-containing protein [Streptomyces sp. NBC_01591]|uniref:cupin domain-containing protein n=1 Tax=Streptomyces sp. NBC_01591 TaxID=2975888 RepID=UPI002DD8083F|nr:cupin domain-containing protein [Streptomyces sp. NBC_01591]WSD66550.1 cupin domain-containing protein [Streptomyces sp. NBC_01591]
MRNLSRLGAISVLLAALCSPAGAAHATPGGPGVTGKTIARTTIGDRDYTLRKITIPPGQGTGWHYHDGTLYGYVRQGTLSHFDATCASDGVYPEGSSLQEPSGADHVHIGQNRGTTDVVLEVLYVLPHGAPFSQDASNPGCVFE